MADFTPINTQEEFDSAIKDRLERQKSKFEKYSSPEDVATMQAEYNSKIEKLSSDLEAMSKKVSKYDADIAERDTKIKGYETRATKSKIAREYGLSYEAIDFLSGDDEETIKTSAEALKKLMGAQVAPTKSYEPTQQSDKTSALRTMVQNMNK